MDTEAVAEIGHNKPPLSIREELHISRKEIFDRLSELTGACQAAPQNIDDEETAKRVSDLLKMSRKAWQKADEARKTEQQPWENGLAETRAAFNVPINRLKDAYKNVKDRHDAFLQRKKDEAKRAAEEKARQQREEMERQAAAAAEAERKRIEAEKAKAEAERAAREAQRQREAALEDARQARAALAQAKEDEARREAERKQREAEQKAEQQRLEREQRQREAEVAKAEASVANRDEKASIDTAVRAEKQAQKSERLAGSSPAELSRTQSDYGAVSSLSRRKVAVIVNFEKLPKGILWGFIHRDAIQVAVNKAMAAGYTERELPGVRIDEIEEGRTV